MLGTIALQRDKAAAADDARELLRRQLAHTFALEIAAQEQALGAAEGVADPTQRREKVVAAIRGMDSETTNLSKEVSQSPATTDRVEGWLSTPAPGDETPRQRIQRRLQTPTS